MLINVWSDRFNDAGEPRPPIVFHPGLNVVEGGAEAENSIGKSTLLSIVDYAFGGADFAKSDVITDPDAVGHHTICFTFRFGEKDRYCSRDTSRPGFVQEYFDPEWKERKEEWQIDDYRVFLAEQYGLDIPDSTLRELIGRFVRIDTEQLAMLEKPLKAAPAQPDEQGVFALEKLFGVYGKLKQLEEDLKAANLNYSSLEGMAKTGLSQYVKIRNKKERDQAERELTQARIAFQQLRVTADLDLFQAAEQAKSKEQHMKTQLRSLQSKRSVLKGKLSIVEATLSGESRLTTDDLEEFYNFFPNVNKEKLETIEYYHRALVGVYEDQLNEQAEKYRRVIAVLDNEINQRLREIHQLKQSVELDDKTYEENGELAATIKRLEAQIDAYDKMREFDKLRKETNTALKEQRPRILGDIEHNINRLTKEFVQALYPNKKRKPPLFSFKESRGKVGYTFSSQGDNGAGSQSKNLISFDLAILELTKLPILIHDSVLIKQLAYFPVGNLLTLYERVAELTSEDGQPKQIFFSFDATPKYWAKAEEIVNRTRVIKLGENEHALYGFTWNEEKDETDEENK